jgi:hypothetical protein
MQLPSFFGVADLAAAAHRSMASEAAREFAEDAMKGYDVE